MFACALLLALETSTRVCMFHVLILMFILALNSEVL